MSRIRSLHPGFYTDEAVMQLTQEAPLAILLLQGLWNEADDRGVFEVKPLTLKAKILPVVDADVPAFLVLLERLNCIRRFTAEGRAYGAVRNFCRYQRPKKPQYRHPLPEPLHAYVAFAGSPAPGAEALAEEEPPPSGGVERAPTRSTPEEDRFPSASPPVENRFPTGGEKPPQREDGGGRREEIPVPSLRSGTPSAAPAAPRPVERDVREEVDTEGLALLRRLTGKPLRPARALLGKLAQTARDDAALLLAVLRQAAEERPHEPVAWLFGAIEARLRPPQDAPADAAPVPPLRRDGDGLLPQQRERVERYLRFVQAGAAAGHQERLRMEGFLRTHDLPAWQVAQRTLAGLGLAVAA
ncbi:hypothetical protein [Teichococcus aestuarii]|uniref:hypothetical protein n=1 Tax=Teichococcus aestuarii TaxID=568898 RepID=UPI00360AA88E